MPERQLAASMNRVSVQHVAVGVGTGLEDRESGGADHTTQIRVTVPSAVWKPAVGRSSTRSAFRPGVCNPDLVEAGERVGRHGDEYPEVGRQVEDGVAVPAKVAEHVGSAVD